MLAAAARVQAWFDLTPQDRCLSVSPLFYSHGLKVTCFTPLLTGGTIAFPTDASKFDYSEWFSRSEADVVFGRPDTASLGIRSDEVRADAKTGHSLRFVLSGGAPLPEMFWKACNIRSAFLWWSIMGPAKPRKFAAIYRLPGRCKLGTVVFPGRIPFASLEMTASPLPAGEVGEIRSGARR